MQRDWVWWRLTVPGSVLHWPPLHGALVVPGPLQTTVWVDWVCREPLHSEARSPGLGLPHPAPKPL